MQKAKGSLENLAAGLLVLAGPCVFSDPAVGLDKAGIPRHPSSQRDNHCQAASKEKEGPSSRKERGRMQARKKGGNK